MKKGNNYSKSDSYIDRNIGILSKIEFLIPVELLCSKYNLLLCLAYLAGTALSVALFFLVSTKLGINSQLMKLLDINEFLVFTFGILLSTCSYLATRISCLIAALIIQAIDK